MLKNGYFHIQSPNPSQGHIQKLLEEWYLQKASTCFHAVFHLVWERFTTTAVAKPSLKIRKMKTRWGSLSNRGRLTLNLDLIKAPKECIEYVVIHELCHLAHRHHDSDFYKLLDAACRTGFKESINWNWRSFSRQPMHLLAGGT